VSRFGTSFYKLPDPAERPRIVLGRKDEKIPMSIRSADGTLEVRLSRLRLPSLVCVGFVEYITLVSLLSLSLLSVSLTHVDVTYMAFSGLLAIG